MAVEKMHSVSVEHLLLGCSSSMLGLKIATFGTPPKVFGSKKVLLTFDGSKKTR